MLIVVYGDDTFRVQEKVRELEAAFVKKFDPDGMNISLFPGASGKCEPGEVLQAVCSIPFLSPRRMVVVRGLVAESAKDAESVWADGLARTPETTIAVLWETAEPKAVEKKALFKKIKALADVHYYPFPALEGPALQTWAADRVKGLGGTIAADAVRELAGRVGSDLWQMSNEIGKLVAYAAGALITAETVATLVRASFEGQIFALVDAISRKQTAQALNLLEQERAAGANDFYLMTMLARQVRILLGARALLDENPRVSQQAVADALGVHPFVASKALIQARAFTLEDLKHTHALLFDFDAGTKSGRLTADLAVDLVTVDLLKK